MRVLRTADMAVTETRCDDPVLGLSGSIQRADAFFVNLTLRDYPNRVYWEDGRQVSVCDMRAGQASIHDLKRDPVALIDKPHHHLFFYLPRDALNAIADDANARRIGDLNYQPVGIDDTTISSLGRAILPALSHPDQVNQLFVEECGLSVSHFSRAFRRTAGAAPHHWLMTRRVEAAKEKLRDSRLSLLDVALACGFSDQSHLTRVFAGMVGLSPGAWRRALE